MERVRRVELVAGTHVTMLSPEDLILAKLVFFDEGGSDKHTRDIEGVLSAQGKAIDRAYIDLWARHLDVAIHWHRIAAAVPAP